jgi:hypothetical protein
MPGVIPVSGTVDVKAPLQDSAVPEDVKAFESLVVEGLGEKGAGVSLRQEETRAVLCSVIDPGAEVCVGSGSRSWSEMVNLFLMDGSSCKKINNFFLSIS